MAKGSKKKASTDERPAPVPAAVPRAAPPPVVPPVVPPVAPVGMVEGVGEFGAATVRAVQAVLPASRTPLLLLGAGLLVVGAVELPVVVGAGLAYEALRRWQPMPPDTVRRRF
jgi:hypothetical protein